MPEDVVPHSPSVCCRGTGGCRWSVTAVTGTEGPHLRAARSPTAPCRDVASCAKRISRKAARARANDERIVKTAGRPGWCVRIARLLVVSPLAPTRPLQSLPSSPIPQSRKKEQSAQRVGRQRYEHPIATRERARPSSCSSGRSSQEKRRRDRPTDDMSAQLANPPSYPQRPAPTAPSATAAPPTSRDHQQYHHLFPPAHSQSLQHNHPHPLLQSPPDQDAAQSDSGELEFDDQLLHQPATAVTAINTTAPIPRPVTATTVSRFSRDDGTPTPTARRGSFSSFFRRSSSRSRSATLEADAPPPSRGVSVDQQRSKGPPPSAGAYYANGSVAPTNKYTSAEPLPADYAERITRSSHDQQSQYLATAAHLKQQARPAHSPSASESYPQPPPSRTSFSSTRHHRVATAPTDANNLTATSAALHQGTRLRKNSFGNGIRSSNTLPSRSNSGAAEISNSKSNTNTASGNASSTSSRMLRKSSRKQRELLLEQERQAREAHANRLAPHISLNPLPNIASFAGEIDQQHYYHHDSSTTSSAAAATTNFSRPGAMSSSGGYVSSSPAYALSSRADPGSSPPTSNGEPSVAGDRTESMRNRGRYSYASSITPANASSPRRVRRRKDPTPFK